MQGEILRRWPEDFFLFARCHVPHGGGEWVGDRLCVGLRGICGAALSREPAHGSVRSLRIRAKAPRPGGHMPRAQGWNLCWPGPRHCRRTRASRLCRACIGVGLSATAGAHGAAEQGAEKIRRAAHAPEETTGEGCGRSDGRRGAGPQLVLPGAPALFAAGSSAEALSGLLWPEGAQEGMPRSMAVPSS